jgi:ribose transport system ATP-binding protein
LTETPSGGARGVVVARARDVSKTFAGTRALAGADLELRRGEIHAVVGGNGSGKSTLIKILAGIYSADSGWLDCQGRTVDLRRSSPSLALQSDFHFVHQEETTFPELTVAENLSIGHGFQTGAMFRVKEGEAHARAASALRRFGVAVDPRAELGSLGPADQTMVAVVRALQDQEEEHSGILVLDEPTAALPGTEVETLLAALRRYATQGQSILIVSHRLDEVLMAADRISVFRDGRRVTTVPRDEVDHDGLVELMVGRPAAAAEPALRASAGENIIEGRGVRGGVVQGADLSVRSGEIVGLTGLSGSGASTILTLLFGAERLEGGEILLDGKPVQKWNTQTAMRAGVALVPADRARRAIFPERSVLENLTAASTSRYWKRMRIDQQRERREATADVSRFSVRTASLTEPIASLSGGNQQKVILARWLRRQPRLVLLDEPTQGVDVAARRDVWSMVRAAVNAGAGALASSSDIEELVSVCDRILIVNNGRIVREVVDQPLDASTVTSLLHAVT